jgi:hypothetical protein
MSTMPTSGLLIGLKIFVPSSKQIVSTYWIKLLQTVLSQFAFI